MRSKRVQPCHPPVRMRCVSVRGPRYINGTVQYLPVPTVPRRSGRRDVLQSRNGVRQGPEHTCTYPIPTYLLQATGTLCFLVGRLLVKLNGAVAQLVPVSLSQCGEYGRSFVPPCFGRRLSGHPIANLSRKRTLITPSATNGRLVGGTVADVL